MTQEEIDALISSSEDPSTEDDMFNTDEDDSSGNNALSDGEDITGSLDGGAFSPKMELLYDLQLPVSIELGRTNMLIREILKLGRGSVVEFDKLVSEPVDVLINGKKIAEGEVVVIDKHFGIRITTLTDPSASLRGLRRS